MIFKLPLQENAEEPTEVEFVRLADLSPSIRLDIRYAREDNFLNQKFYESEDAFLIKHVGLDLLNVHDALKWHGYGLLIFDGYRPASVTKKFWELSSDQQKKFLADPAVGSKHNRGCAVDLSLYHLETGKPAEMPSDFDEMNEKAYKDYTGGTEEQRAARDTLQAIMGRFGFLGVKHEWWHFNHATWSATPILDFTFEEILQAPQTPLPPRTE